MLRLQPDQPFLAFMSDGKLDCLTRIQVEAERVFVRIFFHAS